MITNKDLKRRIIEISYNHKLSHLGSCLTAVDIIDEIYKIKQPDEKFILSAGHAGVALYTIIEKYKGINAEKIYEHHGVHPDACNLCNLDCSTGSLGQGLPIALGMAFADRLKNVYCLISDGECGEGSIWESLQIASEQKLSNLQIYVNVNGWGAYRKISTPNLIKRLSIFSDLNLHIKMTKVEQLPFLKDIGAHYHIMTQEDFTIAMEILK